jgi:hypothetical protein
MTKIKARSREGSLRTLLRNPGLSTNKWASRELSRAFRLSLLKRIDDPLTPAFQAKTRVHGLVERGVTVVTWTRSSAI